MNHGTLRNSPTITLEKSVSLHKRALKSLAGGVSTTFRSYERPVPVTFDQASGSRLTDVDGNEYVDYVCGFGPVILGHDHPAVRRAVTDAIPLQLVGGQHECEVMLAEKLCDLVPSFELVRFCQSGSEAVHAAIRTARATTSRSLIVKFAGHYHGWFDGIYTCTSRLGPSIAESGGQPQSALSDLIVLDWNDPDALKRVFSFAGSRIAAVIMEPLVCNGGFIEPKPGYLELARKLTMDAGALLIFDEVITGFRVGIGGAQQLLGVTPDLTVVGKALGNGFPISAFGGRRDIMENVATSKAFHAGTYCGGGVPVAAAHSTLSVLSQSPEIYSRMRELGKRLMTGLAERASAYGHQVYVDGPGPVFFFWFSTIAVRSFEEHLRADMARYRRFSELLLLNGVRVIPTAGRWYIGATHTSEDIDATIEAADRAFHGLARD